MSQSGSVLSFNYLFLDPSPSTKTSKDELREQLEADVAEFLSNGGKVHEAPPAFNDLNDRRVRVTGPGYYD